MSGLEKMRRLCAKLDDTSERPHFNDVMFYVGKKPFASCGDESGVVVQLEPDHAATLIARDSRFTPYARAKHTVQFDPGAVPQKAWEPLVRESYALVVAAAKKPAKKRAK